MTSLPPELQYGHVVGRIILAVADSGDADTYPDAVPAQGTVTFTPKNPEIRVGEPDPVVVLKQKIVCTIDSTGYLTDPDGKRGVWLVTGVYIVSYSFTAASLPNHDIVVGAEHTQAAPLDLTLALPPGGPVLQPSQYAELTARIDSLVFEAAGVSSVNGATGAVVLDAEDVGALPSTYTPPAQSWADVTEKPETFAPTAHAASHATGGSDPIAPADIGAATATQGAKADSAVQPDDVEDVIREGDARLTDARTPTSHTHAYADITDPPTIPGPQTLSLTGSDLTLSDGGGTVTLPSGGSGSGDVLTPVSGAVTLPTAPPGTLRGYRATGATTFTAPDSSTASLPSGAYVFESMGSGAWTYRTLDAGTPLTGSTPSASAPSKVTGVAAAGDADSVLVSWEVPEDGGSAITGYRVLRGTSAGSLTLLTTKSASSLTHDDTTVTLGTTYFYAIEAVNAVGTGTRSDVASGKTAAVTALVVADDFDRADTARGNTGDHPGTTPTGSREWQGTERHHWGVFSNALLSATNNAALYVETDKSDVAVEVKIGPTFFAYDSLVLRYTDDANFFRIGWTADGLHVYRRQSDAYNVIFESNTTPKAVAGDVFRVEAVGSSWKVKINGTEVYTFTDSFNLTATKHGIFSAGSDTSASHWDDFKVYSL